MTTPTKLRWIKLMYAANVVGAGIPGLIVVLFPGFAAAYMFDGVRQDPVTFGVTGSVWLAIGVLSAVGLRNPLALAGIFPVQLLYKSIWWLAVVVPMVSRGEMRVFPLAVGFLIVMVGFALATPWQHLFGTKGVTA